MMSTDEFILAITGICLIGIPFSIFTFHTVKRLRELRLTKQVSGRLYVTDREVFAEFQAGLEDLRKKKYVVLAVEAISPDEEAVKESLHKKPSP